MQVDPLTAGTIEHTRYVPLHCFDICLDIIPTNDKIPGLVPIAIDTNRAIGQTVGDKWSNRPVIRGCRILPWTEESKVLPFEFVTKYQDRTSRVCIRRLKYLQYRISDILRSCGTEIKKLRELRIPDGMYRELRVRGPGRSWHRYIVLADGVEVLGNVENRQEVEERIFNQSFFY